MPVDDACQSELDAYLAKHFEVYAVRCALAESARGDWYDAKNEAREQCFAEMGPLDQLEFMFTGDALDECIASTASVIEAFETMLDFKADCEIAHEELDALLDEYEACKHALESAGGVP
jgi:hypothetical protein